MMDIDDEYTEKLISGTTLAKSLRDDVRAAIAALHASTPAFRQPTLAMVALGARPLFHTALRLKRDAAADTAIAFRACTLPHDAPPQLILDTVRRLNEDDGVHAISIQIPLGAHIAPEKEREIIDAVAPHKDVDGFHTSNVGHLVARSCTPLFEPCTPAGCLALLDARGVPIAGATALVLGRSDLVGSPVAAMLRNRHATVIHAHSQTRNLPELLKTADIVVVAVGRPNFVKGAWLKPGAAVVDVGLNIVSSTESFGDEIGGREDRDRDRPARLRVVGDVDRASALPVVGCLTPVPGGVGPMNIAQLMANTLRAAVRQQRGLLGVGGEVGGMENGFGFGFGKEGPLGKGMRTLVKKQQASACHAEARMSLPGSDAHKSMSTAEVEPTKA